MRKLIFVCLFFLIVNSVSATIYIDDGLSHTVDDLTYQAESFSLDYNTANNPGTHVDLVDGGEVGTLNMYNNSSITMAGGSVVNYLNLNDFTSATMLGGSVGESVFLTENATATMSDMSVGVSFSLTDNASATINSGSIEEDLVAFKNSSINMSGGSVGDSLFAVDYSTITMSGGSVGGLIRINSNGTIYLDGTGFEVNGNPLVYGDKLSDFGNFFEDRVGGNIYDYYGGTITGTLANGDALNSVFKISNIGYYEGTGDIIVTPEPTTLLLLGLGAVMVRRR